jgi:hypothetical protein
MILRPSFNDSCLVSLLSILLLFSLGFHNKIFLLFNCSPFLAFLHFPQLLHSCTAHDNLAAHATSRTPSNTKDVDFLVVTWDFVGFASKVDFHCPFVPFILLIIRIN